MAYIFIKLTFRINANIKGSNSNVAMNAWMLQASYPCGRISVNSFSVASWQTVAFISMYQCNLTKYKWRYLISKTLGRKSVTLHIEIKLCLLVNKATRGDTKGGQVEWVYRTIFLKF
ncbi:hypothetical protein ROZALSC1DRAFT_24870 [Rozella allomycis CSF55]|uniref:Uncharacterized protein n=1 Tax=Rozella allomycis (strain CSF55) TaxID=988480 RepID=A0A4P9YD55_ROZAC|nr:hypothetical protein ROZALSC1DRAFT_24870 [Rozella allomycis CSF55]